MPVGCVTTVAAGHHALRCDGITWELEISPACARGGCGLVVDVHLGLVAGLVLHGVGGLTSGPEAAQTRAARRSGEG